MNATEILNLKAQLTERLDALRVTLHLSGNNLNPEIQELTTFRNASGLTQFFYYVFNKSRIRAAAEYEALYQLNSQPFDFEPEDLTLLNLFNEGIPARSFQISNEQLNGYEALKKTLYDGFASGKLSSLEQQHKAIENFWDNLKYLLNGSASPTDRILAAYIENRNDCGSTTKPIILPSIRESARPPSFLLSLPDSGNAQDYADSLREHGVKYEQSPILRNNPAPRPSISVETQTEIIFGLFTFTYMSDIHITIENTKTAFDHAKASIRQAREHCKNYMKPFVEGLQLLFKGWRTRQPPVQKSDPVVQPSAPASNPPPSIGHQLVTFAASFIPGSNTAVATETDQKSFTSYLNPFSYF